MIEVFNLQFIGLVFAGAVIAIFAVVVGGGLFIAIPCVQWIFPEATVGAVVGNIKVSSFFRSVGSTVATFRQIEFIQNLKIMPMARIGTLLGASLISHMDQKWMLPAIIFAIIFTLQAPKFAPRVTEKTFALASFGTGIYAGILGAGIGIMLVALLRLKYPEETKIAFVKIQARFVEFLMVVTALMMHILNGNLMAALWIPLSVGALMGGYVGGIILHKMGELSGVMQKRILYVAFAIDLLVATKKFFE